MKPGTCAHLWQSCRPEASLGWFLALFRSVRLAQVELNGLATAGQLHSSQSRTMMTQICYAKNVLCKEEEREEI